ncbi:MAG: DUF11 domain-containing protein, partial [Acidimicrobiia bacterium]|nr:DUF11 domain-containing protein [Acidimicrobiia bacterium]
TLATVGVVDTLGGTVVCDDTVLVPGATTSCALDHIATQVEIDAGTVTSDATASGTDAGGVTTTGSDVLSVPTPEAPGITLIKTGAVDASIVAPTSRPDAGDAIEYSFVVTNTGNVTLTTVGVTDGSLGVSCPGDTLSPDASMTCTATATIGQPDLEAGSVTNTATASGTSPASAVVDATSTEVVALDRVPSVAIAKTSPTSSFDSVGQTIDYDLVVSNTGNVTLEGLNVTDPNADSGSIVCSPAAPFALSPGADATCTAQHTVTQDDLDAGSVDNTASVSGAAPSSGTNVEADSNAVEVQADQRLDLTITQTATAVPLGDGRFTVDYVATVTNTGNVTASSVEIVDDLTGVFGGSAFTVTGSTSTDLPVNLTFDGSTDAVLVSGPVSLAPNASGSVSYRVIVGPTAETGPWSDTIDATIATASLSASGTTGSSVVFDTSFDLAITKTTQKSVAPGDPVTWSIVVTNTGTSASLGTITVTDHLVDDLHYVGFEAEGWSCTHAHGLVTCTTSDPLAAGDATTIGVTTTVHAEIGSTITNSALVVAGDVVNETDPTNNGSVAAVTVDSLPVTGMNTGDVGAIAIALLALGALLVLVSGRRTRRDDRQIV